MSPFRRAVPADPLALAPFRRDLRAWLAGAGLDPGPLADVVLATNEAVTNSIQHAAGIEEVTVDARTREDGVDVTVSDSGRWHRSRPDDERGRGLLIMGALASRVSVQASEAGTTVRMRFAAGSAGRVAMAGAG